jgi:hypothetical protein
LDRRENKVRDQERKSRDDDDKRTLRRAEDISHKAELLKLAAEEFDRRQEVTKSAAKERIRDKNESAPKKSSTKRIVRGIPAANSNKERELQLAEERRGSFHLPPLAPITADVALKESVNTDFHGLGQVLKVPSTSARSVLANDLISSSQPTSIITSLS